MLRKLTSAALLSLTVSMLTGAAAMAIPEQPVGPVIADVVDWCIDTYQGAQTGYIELPNGGQPQEYGGGTTTPEPVDNSVDVAEG